MNVHTQFDIVAATAAAAMTVACFFWRLKDAATRIEHAGFGYAFALVAGAVLGGYAAGTTNLWLSGEPGVARSIVGALAGAIAAIELFKRARGITGSTGLIFVPAFCTSVAIGRWGCFHSGLADHTHGIPTASPGATTSATISSVTRSSFTSRPRWRRFSRMPSSCSPAATRSS